MFDKPKIAIKGRTAGNPHTGLAGGLRRRSTDTHISRWRNTPVGNTHETSTVASPLATVSVTSGQPWPETIRWKNSEINNS